MLGFQWYFSSLVDSLAISSRNNQALTDRNLLFQGLITSASVRLGLRGCNIPLDTLAGFGVGVSDDENVADSPLGHGSHCRVR